MPSLSDQPIAILGAGITGLAAAHALVKQGRRVRLFEATDRVGGPVRSVREGGWLVEAGPNSLQESGPELATLLYELGLEAAQVYALPAARNRYIVRQGRPVPAPTSPPALLTSPLFSWPARLGVMSEVLKRRRVRTADISLGDFARAHFGREFVDYAVNPFVSGVYAGDPEKLSARFAFPSLWAAEKSHGSLIRAQLAAARARRAGGGAASPPRILSFREGLGMLPDALAAQLPPGTLELDARVETLLPDAPWSLVWSRGGEIRTESFARILLALPAAALARLPVGPLGERPLAELDAIEYPPVASLFLGYERRQVRHPLDGFGALVPQRENRQILGVLFNSSLFPGRAPDGHVALTVMLGGVTRPDLGRAELETVLPVVEAELADLLGVTGPPVFIRHHRWPRAIPQYNLGYGRFHDAMARCELAHPGLLIGGSVRDGIALPACLAAGRRLAARAVG